MPGLALLTGELIGLTLAGIGVWYAIRSRRARIGLGIAVLGTAWTAICLFVLIPLFNSGEPSPYYGRFESVGGSPRGVATTLVDDPLVVFDTVTTRADGAYVLQLLLPTVFLALGTPLLLLAAAPQLAVNILSDWWPTTQPMFQYTAPLLPVLIGATIIAMRRLSGPRSVIQSAVLLTAAMACLILWPPIPGGEPYLFASRDSPERLAAMRAAVGFIPEDAPVTVSNLLGAHLSGRREVYQFAGANQR